MKTVSCNIQKIDKTTAEEMLALNVLQAQKARFKKSRLEIIKQLMREGKFRHAEIGIAILHGSEFLVNGQHCLTGIKDLDIEVTGVVERIEVDDVKDISLLFRQYDACWSGRKQRELAAMEIQALALGWPTNLVTLLISALSINHAEVAKMTLQQKVGIIGDFRREGDFLNQIIFQERSLKQFITRGSICAAMLRSYAVSEPDATDFWRNVRDGANLSISSPEMILRDFLMMSTERHRGGIRYENIVTTHEILFRCANAWNARRSGQDRVNKKYIRTRRVPVFI